MIEVAGVCLSVNVCLCVNARATDFLATNPQMARFVYAVGVEGSNHHGVLSQILLPLASERCLQNCTFANASGGSSNPLALSSWAAACGCAVHAPVDIDGSSSHTASAQLRRVLFGGSHSSVNDPKAVRRLLQEDQHAVWLEGNSYPSGWPRGFHGGRRPPAPMDLVDMYTKLSGATSVKLVLLARDFTSTVLSHAKFDGGVHAHANVVANYNEYIAASLARLPADAFYVLPVDCLYRSARARNRIARELRTFLGWTPPNIVQGGECCNCFRKWHSSKHGQSQLSPTILSALNAVASNRSSTWGPLAPREWDCHDQS